MEYAQVTSRLYVGPHLKTIGDIEKLRKLLAITAIMNLQTDEDIESVNLNWKPLEAYYESCAVRLCRVPMKEEQTELREKLLHCIHALERLLADGHTVYLHCTAGVARSPTVAVGYLYCCLVWNLDAAVRYLKQLRQCAPYLEVLRLAILDQEQKPLMS